MGLESGSESRYAKSSLYRTLFGGKKKCGCGKGIGFLWKGGAKKGYGSASGSSANNIYELIVEKKEFLLLVFSNLLVQLGITYYLMMNYKGPDVNTWVILFATIGILMIMSFVPMPSFMKFILFCVFSGLLGLNLSRINDEGKGGKNDGKNDGKKTGSGGASGGASGGSTKDIIHLAVLETIAIFGALFLVGAFLLASGVKLGLRTALFLLYALLLLIIVKIVMIFSGTLGQHIIGLSIIGVILFSLYIIYDTNKILQRDYYGDFITASMDYYLDIVNLFLNLFRLNDQ